MALVKYIIQKDGSYTVETQGIEGKSCANVTDKLIQTIGGTIEDEKHTDDWYKAPKSNVSIGVEF